MLLHELRNWHLAAGKILWRCDECRWGGLLRLDSKDARAVSESVERDHNRLAPDCIEELGYLHIGFE